MKRVLKGAAFFSTSALVAALSWGCAEEVNELLGSRGTEIGVTASFSPQQHASTRAVDNLNTTTGFDLLTTANASSTICVRADNGSGSYTNKEYSITAAKTIAPPNAGAHTFPAGVNTVHVFGWYPYNGGSLTSFTIKSQQTNDNTGKANYCLSDLMLAQPTTSTRSLVNNAWNISDANLNFAHVMSKLKLVVEPASGVTINSITIGDLYPTVDISTTTNQSIVESVGISAAKGTKAGITLLTGGSITSSSTEAQRTFCAVFPPQTFTGNFITITATNNGSQGTITYKLNSGKAFEGNTVYPATISVAATDIGSTIDISAWASTTGECTIGGGASGDAPTLSPTSLTLTFRSGTGSVTASMTGASTFGAVSDATGKATVSASGNTITVTPVAVGSANINIFPTNKSGVFSSAVLPVTINALTMQTSNSSNNGYTTFSTIANQNYTGSEVKPKPTVTVKGSDGNVNLTENTDFTYSWSNNTAEGSSATVTVTGKGNYSGTASTTFTITAINTTLSTVKSSWDDKYLGCYVDASGNVTSAINANSIGRIAYYNNSGVETHSSASGKKILVLAVTNVGSFAWKNENSAGESAYNSESAMNGLDFCANHNNSTTYPAAYNAYNWSTSKPSGSTNWFMPSKAQWNAMLTVAKKSGTGQISSGKYWSSTEYSSYANLAWCYNFLSSDWNTLNKTTSLNVRACFAY